MAPRNSMLDAAGASDSEDDLATALAGGQNRGATAKNSTIKATMPTTRRASTAAAATKRKAPAKTQNRQALKDRTNIANGDDTEGEEVDEDYTAKPKPKRAKITTTTTKARGGNAPPKAKSTKHAPAAETLSVIPETQPDSAREDISHSIEAVDAENMDVTTIPTPPRDSHFAQRARSTSVQPPTLQPRPSARSLSVQPGYPPPRERSGSASGTERERRGADPELRRQLNEVNRKYESLNLKYQNLLEIGQGSAQNQFEKLRRATAEKSRSESEVVAALRKEVGELKRVASLTTSKSGAEGEGLQKQVLDLTTKNGSLITESKNLQSSLQVAQNEVKSLEAKLMAARQQLSAQTSTQEKSAADAKANNAKAGAANVTDAQKEAKMIQNLYSDLTGLIVRSVKRKEGEDEYDCIQTGRNGTLHFHLSIATDASISNPKTPSGLSYEEAEFAYEPLLDESRDRDLMDLLPDYLSEEICFPRNQAVKFYGKVCESMTRRVVVEE